MMLLITWIVILVNHTYFIEKSKNIFKSNCWYLNYTQLLNLWTQMFKFSHLLNKWAKQEPQITWIISLDRTSESLYVATHPVGARHLTIDQMRLWRHNNATLPLTPLERATSRLTRVRLRRRLWHSALCVGYVRIKSYCMILAMVIVCQ